MDVNDVAAELAKHEAVCAERWKTIFNRIEKIDVDSGIRFDKQERTVTRLETILIGASSTGLAAAGGIIWQLLSM
jgi:hypothetical protein|tara:strand:+ start:2291 stop:2515 length:225 start_codon:yes stop_codon:yes gene_type:complete